MGYLNLAVVQKRSQILLLVQGVIYRVLRLAVGNIRAEHDALLLFTALTSSVHVLTTTD